MVSVNTIQAGTVFAWFMFLMVLRRVALLITAMVAGRNKPFVPGSRAPEDRMLKRGQIQPTSSDIAPIEYTKELRAMRVIGNDTENDSYFFILLLATAAFSDSVSLDCTRTIVYGTIYLFFRLCYALAYIFALQPWRTILFAFSLACTFACSLDLLITMSRRSN